VLLQKNQRKKQAEAIFNKFLLLVKKKKFHMEQKELKRNNGTGMS
jgi:hypothetical protein